MNEVDSQQEKPIAILWSNGYGKCPINKKDCVGGVIEIPGSPSKGRMFVGRQGFWAIAELFGNEVEVPQGKRGKK